MNKENYRSAVEKLSPGKEWQEKTLAAMRAQAQQETEPEKQVRFPAKAMRRTAFAAAAVVLMVLVPTMTGVFGHRDDAVLYAAQEVPENMERTMPAADVPGESTAKFPEKQAAVDFYAVNDEEIKAAGNPTAMIADEKIPRRLGVFEITESEDEMRAALGKAAGTLGAQMTDFSYDEKAKSAWAKAGNVLLSMKNQRVNMRGAQTIELDCAEPDATDAQRIRGYYDVYAKQLCAMQKPGLQITEKNKVQYKALLFDTDAEDLRTALEKYNFSRTELTIRQKDGALISVDYFPMPKLLFEGNVKPAEDALLETGKTEQLSLQEICYRIHSGTLYPYYHFIFSDESEAFVPALK